MSTLLITGASRGVGRALALACARSGKYSKIILNGGSDSAALEETSRLVSSAGDLLCVSSLGDVGDLRYVESLRRDFGPVNVLVNNAAVSSIPASSGAPGLYETPDEDPYEAIAAFMTFSCVISLPVNSPVIWRLLSTRHLSLMDTSSGMSDETMMMETPLCVRSFMIL